MTSNIIFKRADARYIKSIISIRDGWFIMGKNTIFYKEISPSWIIQELWTLSHIFKVKNFSMMLSVVDKINCSAAISAAA